MKKLVVGWESDGEADDRDGGGCASHRPSLYVIARPKVQNSNEHGIFSRDIGLML